MANSDALRLMAEDEADLKIISAAVQDAVTQIGNLRYKSRERRFQVELNRFRWEDDSGEKHRVRAILGFDGVMSVRVRGLPQNEPEMVISVLSLSFEPASPPGGWINILLAGDGEISLDVEAIDVTLLDSDFVWPTRKAPDHEKRRR